MLRYSLILFFLLPITVIAQRKDHQVGLRVGEPMGLSYKFFVKQKAAIEFIVGTAAEQWSQRYYQNSFSSYDDLRHYEYLSHRVKNVLYFQARYVIQKPINWEVPGTTEWYWGAGVLSKTAKVEYFYTDPEFGFFLDSEKVTDLDVGFESIIGVEYGLQGIPLSMFLEFSILAEVFDRGGAFRGFSAIGLRYNF